MISEHLDQPFTFFLSLEDKERWKVAAKTKGISMAALIRQSVNAYIDKDKSNESNTSTG